jgi:hypothetical protein
MPPCPVDALPSDLATRELGSGSLGKLKNMPGTLRCRQFSLLSKPEGVPVDPVAQRDGTVLEHLLV